MRRLIVLAMLAACGSSDDETIENAASVAAPIEAPKDAIAKTTESGPVKATIQVWPAKPTLGDPIYARLEVEAPAGVDIDAPFQEAGDQRLGRFRVVGFTRGTKHVASGQVHEQTYTLEAQTSGRHRVPPLRFEILDGRGGANEKPKPLEVLTDEVPLDIQPVPAQTAFAPLKPAVGDLDPDVGGTSWLAILGMASAVVVVGSGSLLAWRALRAKRRIAQQRSAYDEAIAQLRVLGERGAPDAESADGWFVELSAIVRRYLEQRYDIRAPELTTEEFLLVATARPEVSEEHRSMLNDFLERCDRVKFAGYRPEPDESLATLAAAGGFVEDTRIQEAA
jgi:hypothetical protein